MLTTNQPPGAPAPSMVGLEPLAGLYPEFLAALLAGNRRLCEGITNRALAADVPVLMIYQHLFQRALYEVGEEWAANRISVGVEHLATAVIEGLLNQLYARIVSATPNGRRIVISSVEGELHQVGAKMASDVFESHGWEALYLGADTPTHELLRTVHDLRPDAVGLSLSIAFHLDKLRAALDLLRAAFPQLSLFVGGQGLRELGGRVVDDPNVRYFADLDTLDRYLSEPG